MFGTLNEAQIEKLLTDSLIGRIGCHAQGKTYIVPISYAYYKDCIYAHTFEGLKIQMMRQNPHVCFEVEDLNDIANWRSVIAWGKFKELNTIAEKEVALEHLAKRKLPLITSQTMKLTNEWPFVPQDASQIEGIFFRIILSEKTGRFESAESHTK